MTEALFLPEHGGNIDAAAKQFGIAKEQWLDLSSAVNPWHYPIGPLPEECFTELPYWQTQFLQAARDYYGQKNFTVGAGTQAFIETLPEVLPAGNVLLPEQGYQEHKKSWRYHHRLVSAYPSFNAQQSLAFLQSALRHNNQQHVLIINPNNPTASVFSAQALRQLALQLERGYYLIVDEAFVDSKPEQSLLNASLPNNIIVLRSFGKFFGLPGLRLGFAFADNSILQALNHKMPLWQITGASQHIAAKALADKAWQQQTRQLIHNKQQEQRAQLMLACDKLNGQWQQADLFSSVLLSKDSGIKLYQGLAQQGILLRFWQLDTERVLLRFALCAGQPQLTRLIQTITSL